MKFVISLTHWLAIFLLSFLFTLPVLLLPLVTNTPSYVSVVLIGLVVLLFGLALRTWFKDKKLVFRGELLVVTFLAIIASQYFAGTPAILDESGKPQAGSIATMEKVIVNGTEQWITIRGKDATKPVLLYLGIGGPGAGGFPATFTSLKPLEDDFVVVNWDQPGTGKSYGARPINSLTPQIIVDDAYALTQLLRERFHQEKIYVMGLSWGTIVGIELIQQHPELYYAYVGNGQMVNTVENDRFGYNLAVKLMTEKGDRGTLEALKNSGEPPYTGNGMALKYARYNNVLFDHMDSANLQMVLVLVPQLAKEYGYIDKLQFDLGLIQSFSVLYPQLTSLDFIATANKLAVPVYFIVGKKDVNAVASIVERYFNSLEAPYKELIWLESGHGATAEEWKDAMVNHVLVTSPPSEDNAVDKDN